MLLPTELLSLHQSSPLKSLLTVYRGRLDLATFDQKFLAHPLNTHMRFRTFLIEQGPPPGPMGGPPPMGGPGGAPPMGGMGGPPPMGGMGGMGDPMGGMGGPMGPGGGMPGPPQPQAIPQHADVWDVLDAILHKKPIEQEEELKKQKEAGATGSAGAGAPPGAPMPPPPPGPHLMG